jgi:hypothetical protein
MFSQEMSTRQKNGHRQAILPPQAGTKPLEKHQQMLYKL